MLAHLSDKRRAQCATEIVRRDLPKMSVATVQALDVEDRRLRREARRSGHSHAIAVRPALTVAGKFTGHVKS